MSKWTEFPGGTNKDFWQDFELLPIPREEFGVPEYRAGLRFDGCVHLNRYFNGDDPLKNPDCDSDYFHICGLQDFIEDMQSLLEEGRKRFGADWGK